MRNLKKIVGGIVLATVALNCLAAPAPPEPTNPLSLIWILIIGPTVFPYPPAIPTRPPY